MLQTAVVGIYALRLCNSKAGHHDRDGSGKADRDETAFGHKPFLVLADALTRAGYAVLRCDKRGVGQSTGDGRSATTLDLQRDATSAMTFLAKVPHIDRSRIAIVGHSEDVDAAIRCGHGPILFLNGSTDHQVIAAPNLAAARAALGHETAVRRTRLLPGLSHLFQESASGSSNDYATITQTMSPVAIRAVIGFLDETLEPTH